jgi:beta-RFAP synthase
LTEINPITPAQAPHTVEKLAASSDVVSVTATARLHFGFLDPSGRGPRPFGSFGLSLDQPQTRLVLKRDPTFQVSGAERERAERYLKSIATNCNVTHTCALHIEEAIPPHAGLGSGTQLALAVGSAFAALEGLKLTPQQIATRLGRGSRSGIGIGTFAFGGTVLDAGPYKGALPEIVARVPYPEAWRAILIFDPKARGLAGDSETAAFEAMPEFPESKTETLYRRIMQSALPALANEDFTTFCAEIGYLQEVMGAYFAPLQGGPYVSPGVSDALAWLASQGVTGLGQSSWGPTGFAFVSSEDAGETLLAGLRSQTKTGGLEFRLARGRNEGAVIETNPQENR